jgi:hypothetical protein
VDSSKAQRLRDNIAEQVNSLQDVLSSMDEVYAGDGLDQQSRLRANMGAQAQ